MKLLLGVSSHIPGSGGLLTPSIFGTGGEGYPRAHGFVPDPLRPAHRG
jgi:hypothetical protein